MRHNSDPPVFVYGVFEEPLHMLDGHEVESVWGDERRASDRARVRSTQVHGKVHVLSWPVNSTRGRAVLRVFEDGECVTGRRT